MEAIHRLIARARTRLRLQAALEGATTATIIAAVIALCAIVAMRLELVSGGTGLVLLAIAGAAIVAGAVIGALHREDDERVARRIDRASNLADRLSTAVAFQRALTSSSPGTEDPETLELMRAAIADGSRAVPRANLRAATPFREPRDLRVAICFLAVSAITAGLSVPTTDRAPHVWAVDPDHANPGEVVTLRGVNLLAGVDAPGAVPTNAFVYLGGTEQARPAEVVAWTRDAIEVRIPTAAKIGETSLTAYIGARALESVRFTVTDPKDARYHKEESVLLDADERAYIESILGRLKELAKREKIRDLDDFIAKIEKLLADAELGKITKEQLLAELAKAEELLNQGSEPDPQELQKKLAELGKELQKDQLTQELGKALEQNQLEKAKEELEELARKLEKSGLEKEKQELEKKLADPNLSDKDKQELQKKLDEVKKQLEKELEALKKQLEDPKLDAQQKQDLQKKLDAMKQEKPLTEQQKQDLQKQLDNVAQQLEKQNQKDQQQQNQQQQKLEEQIRRLEKQRQEAETDRERQDAERQLQQKKDELQKLQKDNDQKQQSEQRQALKRLQRNMEKAAEQLQKPQQQESQQEQQERERQASEKIRDAARETGKVDQDQRKRSQQKKMSSQMDDLREALRRAKQKGNKGNDPFGKNAKNQDLAKRSRGGKGNGGAWKPGQGQSGQQGGNGQQQGQQPGGKEWGVGHDDDMTGDPTAKTGNTKDQDLEGKIGSQGTSKRETILAAAQKGFASRRYSDVYQEYEKIVEEVMRAEKLPSSYKYYVKRYFARIQPQAQGTSN